MNLFENWRNFIITFVLTIIIGWYLGLSISTTIDNRLKNATIHMPKPKNNITIEVLKKPKSIKINDNSDNALNFFSNSLLVVSKFSISKLILYK